MSYQDAYSASQNGGYENSQLVESVVLKNLRFREEISKSKTLDLNAVRTIMFLGLATSGSEIRVLDFGGAGGYHHAIARVCLGAGVNISNWSIVETPAMCTAADLLQRSDGLRFFKTIDEAIDAEPNFDVVFSSSALQYCPEPLAIASRLFEIGARYVISTRVPFCLSGETVFAVQSSLLSHNGPGPMATATVDRVVKYPMAIVPIVEFERLQVPHKYKLRFRTVEEPNALRVDSQSFHYFGHFFEQ